MTMTKSFITNLTNLQREDYDVLPDPSHVMLCSIHSAVNATSNSPQCEHRMLHLCPSQGHYSRKNKASRSITRKRSKSPKNRSCSEKSSATSGKNLATIKTSTAIHNHKNTTYPNQSCQHPGILSSSFINVEKTSSCPNRSCCTHYTSQPDSEVKHSSIKSQSTLEMTNLSTANGQIVRHVACTDEVVTGLKDEIEKVKSQLLQISLCRGLNIKKQPDDISQLKAENKYLKKQLEQKKKNQHLSMHDIEKAKEIMYDYEKKVVLLHEQAIKSSKLMKQSKEKFCKCLREKENLIKELQKDNKELSNCATEKCMKYDELNKAYENLQNVCCKNEKKIETVEDSNGKLCQCIKELENQLQSSMQKSEQYKQEIKELQQKFSTLKCEICQKLETRVHKQKEKYENHLKQYEENKNKLKNEILTLSTKIKDAETTKLSLKNLESSYSELQNKLVDYENWISRYKILEEECKKQHYLTIENEKRFEKEREGLRQLVDELTTVVKYNKATLLKLSDINKQQENLLESQSAILLQKDAKLRMAESTIDLLRNSSLELSREVEDLKRSMAEPCSKEACISASKQLEEMRKALNMEKDNHLMKEKIIEDQSQTICSLQCQVKEKLSELSKAREETSSVESEMIRINNDLVKKHKELEIELYDKERLLKKLKKLEFQKTLLSKEMEELQILLQQYYDSEQYDDEEREIVANLQRQVEQQRIEWEAQRENLANEKENAIRAAKFATQKLLDTVTDFQKQTDTQKKVQNMLTKMLHDKEEELKIIKSKIFSINSITSDLEIDVPLDELFKRKKEFDLSDPATTSSFYSSCSNGSKILLRPNNNVTNSKLTMLKRTDEVPMRDINY